MSHQPKSFSNNNSKNKREELIKTSSNNQLNASIKITSNNQIVSIQQGSLSYFDLQYIEGNFPGPINSLYTFGSNEMGQLGTGNRI